MPSSETSWLALGVAVLSLLVATYIHWYNARLKSVSYVPGMRVLFSPISLFGAVLPTTWWNPGLHWNWRWRKTAYENHQRDMISVVPFVFGKPFFYTGSLHVAKQLLVNDAKVQMEKPLELVVALLLWGDNLIASNGEMWKRHRRLLNPAFTRDTYSMVVDETISLYHEIVSAEGWAGKTSFVVEQFNRIPQHMAFIIIARVGFDVRLPWTEYKDDTDESELSFGEALKLVCETTIPRLALPSWAYRLPIESLRRMDRTWKSMEVQMNNLVLHRKEELNAEAVSGGRQRNDLFSRLVAALDEEAKVGLSMQEVIGNTFAMMFAGHETTAHVLTATLGFLAIYQEEQDKAVAEIANVIPEDKNPTLDHLAELVHVSACFHEALRIYPAGVIVNRVMLEDTTVEVEHPRKETIPLQKGSLVVMDMIGIHHDPHVFPDPDKFKPSRWYGTHEHDISMFGLGPRACIGRKFAHIEALTFLSLFLRDWKVDIVPQPNETRSQYEARVMENAKLLGLAFGIESLPLKLTKRDAAK